MTTFTTDPMPQLPQEVLSSLAKRLLLDPLSDRPEPFLADMSGDETKALRTLADDVNVPVEVIPRSRDAQTRLLARVTTLLAGPALSGARGAESFQRLGEAGLLVPARYTVSFLQDRFKPFEEHGIDRSQVEELIRNPDAVQHILPRALKAEDFPPVSLLAKRIVSKREPPFVMLVQARREGADLLIQGAWKLPEEILIRSTGADLVGALRAFVDLYGLRFKVLDGPFTKFVYYQAFQLPANTELAQVIGFEAPLNRPVLGMFMTRITTSNVLEIAMAYAIDEEHYLADWSVRR